MIVRVAHLPSGQGDPLSVLQRLRVENPGIRTMTSLLSVLVQHINPFVARSGYVLILASSMMMWWGLYVVANELFTNGQSALQQVVTIAPDCPVEQQLASNQQQELESSSELRQERQDLCKTHVNRSIECQSEDQNPV